MTAPTKVVKPSGIYWAGKPYKSVLFELEPELSALGNETNTPIVGLEITPELLVSGLSTSYEEVLFELSLELGIEIPRILAMAELTPELLAAAHEKYLRSVVFELTPELSPDGYGITGPAFDALGQGLPTTVGSSFSRKHSAAAHSNVFVDIAVLDATILTGPTYDGQPMAQLSHVSGGTSPTLHMYRYGIRDEAGGVDKLIAWSNSSGAVTNMSSRSYTGVRNVATTVGGYTEGVTVGKRLTQNPSLVVSSGQLLVSGWAVWFDTPGETHSITGASVSRSEDTYPVWLASYDVSPTTTPFASSYHNAGSLPWKYASAITTLT